MRRSGELPELLAPAGSYEALLAAVAAGADAIYIGGKSFGARAFAENFDIDSIKGAVEYCHMHSVKLYVTVNTLIFDKEMPELAEYLKALYIAGVDALIVADLGAISLIKSIIPGMPIHASTQMSVHSVGGANAAYSLGCERVVPARELDIENITDIVENSPSEVEIFLHGALCVSFSGQCLMSSLVGGRSGNRGECAQPCRLPYNNGKYILSLRDLSYAKYMERIISSGVSSLKIEGRMKSADYVYEVTSIYRRLLDEHRSANNSEWDRLGRIFSRGGFAEGYFTGNYGKNMTGVRSEDDKNKTRATEKKTFAPEKVKARCEVELSLGKPSVMTLKTGEKSVTVTGAIPTEAISAPLDKEGVATRLCKMGNTFISLSPEDVEIKLDEGINLPPSAINELRRSAAAALQFAGREYQDIPTPTAPKRKDEGKLRTAQFFNLSSYERYKEIAKSDFFDIEFIPLFEIEKAKNTPSGVALPPVIFDTEYPEFEKMLEIAREKGVKYALVGNVGQIAVAREHGFLIVGDFRLNVTNSFTKESYKELGVEKIILSPELTLPQARDIGGGVTVYGRLPLMITQRCFITDNFGCDKCRAGTAKLVDRQGASFPMMREYRHRNVIFNSTHTYMGDKKDELARHGARHLHFIFSTETGEEIATAIERFKSGAPLGTQVRRVGKR